MLLLIYKYNYNICIAFIVIFSVFDMQGGLKEIIPKFWDPKDKCKFLALDEGKLRVSYKGTGKYDTDAAAIRTDRPVPPACGLFYFEVHIVDKGRDG